MRIKRPVLFSSVAVLVKKYRLLDRKTSYFAQNLVFCRRKSIEIFHSHLLEPDKSRFISPIYLKEETEQSWKKLLVWTKTQNSAARMIKLAGRFWDL